MAPWNGPSYRFTTGMVHGIIADARVYESACTRGHARRNHTNEIDKRHQVSVRAACKATIDIHRKIGVVSECR